MNLGKRRHVFAAALCAFAKVACGEDPVAARASVYSELSASARLGIAYKPAAAQPAPAVAPAAGTVSMPRYIVKESREKLGPADILTPKATLDLAKDTYLSPLYRVTFGPLAQLAAYYTNVLTLLNGWHPNDAEAAVLLQQDRRLQKLNEIDSLIDLELIDDPKASKSFELIRFDASTKSR
jgi:hypothetical protein